MMSAEWLFFYGTPYMIRLIFPFPGGGPSLAYSREPPFANIQPTAKKNTLSDTTESNKRNTKASGWSVRNNFRFRPRKPADKVESELEVWLYEYFYGRKDNSLEWGMRVLFLVYTFPELVHHCMRHHAAVLVWSSASVRTKYV